MVRRPLPLVPALALTAGAWLLLSKLSGLESEAFLTARAGQRAQPRSVMHGFKDEFKAWRRSLTQEQRDLLAEQVAGQYDKNYRKNGREFEQLPQEVAEGLGKVYAKFLATESDEYKRSKRNKPRDLQRIQHKSARANFDWSMRSHIDEINRDMGRRYRSAQERLRRAEASGEYWGPTYGVKEIYRMGINDTEHLQWYKHFFAEVRDALLKANMTEKAKTNVREFCDQKEKEAEEAFASGSHWEWNIHKIFHEVPVAMYKEIRKEFMDPALEESIEKKIQEKWANMPSDPAEQKTYNETQIKWFQDWADNQTAFITEECLKFSAMWIPKWHENRLKVFEDAEWTLRAFRSQEHMPGKTKADLARALFAAIEEETKKKAPELEPEEWAALEKIPATDPDSAEFRHSWGTSRKLWKSEAYDPFGQKYLLGIYETVEEAQKAFDDWNAEYEENRLAVQEEVQQWAKAQNARIEKEEEDHARLRNLIKEGQANPFVY